MKKLIFLLLVACCFCYANEFKYRWATYTTYFNEHIDERQTNIKVAARYLDGFVLLPKTIFSFNDEVTSRISENELGTANTLVGEKRVPGYGGGLCQVSSTLYAAALYAGLSIFERKPHSKIVSYILPGLDATVSKEQGVDLKIYNPYNFRFIIKASVDGNALNISIFGEKPKMREIEIIVSKPEKQGDFIYTITTRRVFTSGKEVFSEIVSRDYYY
jgi:vancomycin resistance protein YoaR